MPVPGSFGARDLVVMHTKIAFDQEPIVLRVEDSLLDVLASEEAQASPATTARPSPHLASKASPTRGMRRMPEGAGGHGVDVRRCSSTRVLIGQAPFRKRDSAPKPAMSRP